MTINEVVKKYPVGRVTVDRAVKSGKLVAYNPSGRKYLIYPSDVEAWFESTRITPQEVVS